MFHYVHTIGNIITRDNIDMELLKPYVDIYLYSLINGLRQTSFGFDTVDRVAKSIEELYNNLVNINCKLYIDSGGYSIIVGDVHSRDIRKFIDSYNYFLESYSTKFCDKIFSLDIPIFLNEPLNNTCDNIYTYNYLSCYYSKQILDKNPILYDKYSWVLHFKLEKQFNIWRTVYDELFADEKELKNFSIGGLVGLRKITNIKFSPFIVPIYRLLKIIRDKNLNYTSLIHILGVYGLHDRFIMYFLDKLFNTYYLKDKQCSIDITFDTINYTLSGLYKVREMPFILHDKNTDNYSLGTASDFIHELEDVIPSKDAYELIKKEMILIQNNENLTNPKTLALLYVAYNQTIDNIMKKCIDDENLLDKFLECEGNYNKFNTKYLIKLLNKWKQEYTFIFNGLENKIQANFMWISSMHYAWEDGAKDNMTRIDNGILKFINAINFPFDLTGNFKY